MIKIENNISNNFEDISTVHKLAFGEKEGKEIIKLLNNLSRDKTAQPLFSIVAFNYKKLIGHVLFTNAKIKDNKKIRIAILAPLAVLPDFQKTGTGTKLIKNGFKILKKEGYDFIFTYGDPDYYSKFGFESASKLNIKPPQKIPKKYKDAWMIKQLNKKEIKNIEVDCAESLKEKKYWE
jgi:putative acetyltransferase